MKAECEVYYFNNDFFLESYETYRELEVETDE